MLVECWALRTRHQMIWSRSSQHWVAIFDSQFHFLPFLLWKCKLEHTWDSTENAELQSFPLSLKEPCIQRCAGAGGLGQSPCKGHLCRGLLHITSSSAAGKGRRAGRTGRGKPRNSGQPRRQQRGLLFWNSQECRILAPQRYGPYLREINSKRETGILSLVMQRSNNTTCRSTENTKNVIFLIIECVGKKEFSYPVDRK